MRHHPLYKPFSHMVLTYVAAHCASSAQRNTADITKWQHLDWKAVDRRVKSLQSRIAKAVKIGRWNKVKVLQRILTRSYATRLLAIRQVTQNKGKRSAGIDGVLWKTPHQKMQAVKELGRRGYRSQPLRRVCIPKPNGGIRKLGIPTMKDRAMQALYALALDPVSETLADPHSYGFRRYRSTHDAREAVFNVLCRTHSSQWILEADIATCFDSISHAWLLENICIDTQILHQWLKAGIYQNHRLYPTTAGTPQGGVISPLLANRTLDGLEAAIDNAMGIPTVGKKQHRRRPNPHRIHVIRYADDFVVTATNPTVLSQEIMPIIEAFLAKRGLSLSLTKTKITHINEGFDFLGQHVRKYKGKLLIKPAKKNVRSLLAKVKQIADDHKGKAAHLMLRNMNSVLSGWVHHYQHAVSSRIFSSVDHKVFYILWRWACRRHPNKSKRWIKRRYFDQIKGKRWRFAVKDTRGKLFPVFLARHIRIYRHTKIRDYANPYDPKHEAYFEQRQVLKMYQRNQAKKRVRALYEQQEGGCPKCGERISLDTLWHIHHIIPLYLGGRNVFSNLVLLHPWCHHMIHREINLMNPTKTNLTAGLRNIIRRLTQA